MKISQQSSGELGLPSGGAGATPLDTMCPVTYKGYEIVPAAVKLPDAQWKIQGAINPATGSGFGENFEAQNHYPSKESAEEHFIAFAKRYIDRTATRTDIDQAL